MKWFKPTKKLEYDEIVTGEERQPPSPANIIGMFFCWIPMLLGLNPWWIYDPRLPRHYSLFIDDDEYVDFAGGRRMVATMLALADIVLSFFVFCVTYPNAQVGIVIALVHVCSFVIGFIGVTVYGMRFHPKIRYIVAREYSIRARRKC